MAEGVGHYLVLLHMHDREYPRFIDGTTGEVFDWARGQFLRVWSGYALVVQRPRTTVWLTFLFGLIAALSTFGFGLILLRLLWRRWVQGTEGVSAEMT
jgi:hypothetical protein